MRNLSFIALLLVAACAPVPASIFPPAVAQSAQASPRDAAEQAEAAACPAKGGHLDRVGKAQALRCIIRYADAGKNCTDGAQCLGQRCMGDPRDEAASGTVTGQCVATNDPFGCQTIIRDGKAATICVD